jgi:hypothetical protein
MNGPGNKIYYNQDGSMDWLKTIVRTVYTFTERRTMTLSDIDTGEEFHHNEDVVFVKSVAAPRAQRLYYKKTDIQNTL